MKKISSLAAALFFACSAISQIPTANLIAHYPFCGNANDASGNGLNGVVTGALLGPDRFGNPNSAYSFNGSTDYISLPPASFVGLDIYSYSMWIKPSSNAATGFIAYSVGSASDPYCLSMNYNAPSVFAGCYNSGGNPMQSYVVSSPLSTISNWIHVVVTRDYSALKLYVNGFLMQQLSSAGINNQSSDYGTAPYRAVIGARSTLQNPFPGQIDDARIYASVLTQSDVNALFNETPFLISVNSGTICRGNTFVFTPAGAVSYTFSGGSQTVSPISSSNYTITGLSSNGCLSSVTANVVVNICTGTGILQSDTWQFKVFPNPSTGNFSIQWEAVERKSHQFIIRDLTGRIVKTFELEAANNTLQIVTALIPGCYIGELIVDGKSACKKRISIQNQ